MAWKLVEQTFDSRNEPELYKALFGEPQEALANSPFIHCIYLDGGSKYAVTEIFTECYCGYIGYSTEFSEYIKREKPLTFMDFLFLIKAYHDLIMLKEISINDLPKLRDTNFRKIGIVDEILNNSSGRLLWVHQLEELIGIFSASRLKNIELVQRIRARHTDAYDIISGMKFNEISVADIIDERAIDGNIDFPNMRGASLLYDFHNVKDPTEAVSIPYD